MLYSPYEDALPFAEGVLALEQGDANIILELNGSPLPDICPANASQPFDDGDFDAKTAVWFGDSLADGNRTFAQAQANYQAALNLSEFATLWYPVNQAGYTYACLPSPLNRDKLTWNIYSVLGLSKLKIV